MTLITSLLLTGAGALIGVADSVIGGGTLFTMLILLLLGATPIEAVVTTRIIALFQTLSAGLMFTQKKLIYWKQALPLGIIAAIGSLIGAHFVLKMENEKLSLIIGIIITILIFLVPYVQKRKIKIAENLNGSNRITRDKKRFALLIIMTFLLGIYGGFNGAAVGMFLLFSALLIGESRILISAANTKIVDLFLNISASAVFLTNPESINWVFFIPLSVGGIVGGIAGVQAAEEMEDRYLGILLYIMMIAVAGKIILTDVFHVFAFS